MHRALPGGKNAIAVAPLLSKVPSCSWAQSKCSSFWFSEVIVHVEKHTGQGTRSGLQDLTRNQDLHSYRHAEVNSSHTRGILQQCFKVWTQLSRHTWLFSGKILSSHIQPRISMSATQCKAVKLLKAFGFVIFFNKKIYFEKKKKTYGFRGIYPARLWTQSLPPVMYFLQQGCSTFPDIYPNLKQSDQTSEPVGDSSFKLLHRLIP